MKSLLMVLSILFSASVYADIADILPQSGKYEFCGQVTTGDGENNSSQLFVTLRPDGSVNIIENFYVGTRGCLGVAPIEMQNLNLQILEDSHGVGGDRIIVGQNPENSTFYKIIISGFDLLMVTGGTQHVKLDPARMVLLEKVSNL